MGLTYPQSSQGLRPPPPVIASRGYEIQFLPGDFADIGHQQLAFGVNVMR